MSNCKKCNGDGFYYRLPSGKNAFEMSIDTIAKAAIRYDCACKEQEEKPKSGFICIA